MYESPIAIKTKEIARNIMDKQEEYILTQVQMCVDVDKDELIKALEYDRGQYEKGWNDRNNEIVRCKDCKYHKRIDWSMGDCKYPNGFKWIAYDNDFCSRGERKDETT